MGAASLRQRGAHARQGVQFSGRQSALRPSIFEGKHPPCHGGDKRRPPAGPTETAADFAWLFDK